jgi:glyoxylase-like metal-dependent hydrolase (beta-lactamase superfamily II)
VRELFVPCYLIEHEKGKLLWDTGLAVAAAGKGRVTVDGGSFVYERSIIDQLAAMHVAPKDLTVAFSHLHFDHAGGANALTEAKVLMQKAEWESALAGNPEFDASVFDKLKGIELTIVEGDYDVFGDGTVKLIYAPGHTPGHQALFVDLQHFGPLVLSGDLYHFRISRAERRVPTFNFDAPMTLRSMDKVEALVEDTGATFWIEHDKALADTLKKAPEFYD